jgi:hypothetical protein
MRKFILLILTSLLFIWQGCQNNSVPPDERLNEIFEFNNVFYIYHGQDEGSGNFSHFGKIKFSQNDVTITLNNGEQEVTDLCKIRRVIFIPEKNEYKYFTSKGDIYAKISNNKINEVQNFTSIGFATFSKK